MDVKFSSEASEKMQEECRPGAPYVTFRKDPSVSINLINNQPHSGVFSVNLPIMEDDTVSKLAKRLARMERLVKDPNRVKFFRYEDPVLGPRKIPSMDRPLEGKVAIKEEEKFSIDVEKNVVTVNNSPLGNDLIYQV